MQIKNYPQFAKKTFLLGMDRNYLVLLFFVFVIIYVFMLIFGLNLIFLISIAGFTSVVSIIAFKRNNYFFEKFIIKAVIKARYKFIKNILAR